MPGLKFKAWLLGFCLGVLAISGVGKLDNSAMAQSSSLWKALNVGGAQQAVGTQTTSSTNPLSFDFGTDQSRVHRLSRVKGFKSKQTVEDVIPLGDGKSFIIVDSAGFTVYSRESSGVKAVGGAWVSGLQKVEPLGDGHGFVVTSTDEFVIYEVQDNQLSQR
jgi:hypothetical protein